jgi:predicted lipoprotein with Yx(FWY)xxD motif
MVNRLTTVGLGLGVIAVMAAVVAIATSALAKPSAAARLTVRSTQYGKALFGPSGKVVYVFGADRGSTSRCYGACANAWPPLLTTGAPLAALRVTRSSGAVS